MRLSIVCRIDLKLLLDRGLPFLMCSTYKVKALELLAKHLGMFDSKNGGSEAPENNIFEVIDQSTREEIDTDGIPEIEHPAKPGHDLVE